jgi:hypothetical protein
LAGRCNLHVRGTGRVRIIDYWQFTQPISDVLCCPCPGALSAGFSHGQHRAKQSMKESIFKFKGTAGEYLAAYHSPKPTGAVITKALFEGKNPFDAEAHSEEADPAYTWGGHVAGQV